MARILGVDIPNQKKINVSLTYIYGIGDSRALEICKKANVDPEKRTGELTENEFAAIREVGIKYTLEGDLRRNTAMDIKRLQEINC